MELERGIRTVKRCRKRGRRQGKGGRGDDGVQSLSCEDGSSHLTLFLHPQPPSFMPASFPSSSRPVGLQHPFTVHLTSKIQNSDLIYWCTVWFLQTETRRLTERKVFVVALAARPVWGHICLCSSSSSNLQRLCLSGKKRPFSPHSSVAEQNFNVTQSVFVFSAA